MNAGAQTLTSLDGTGTVIVDNGGAVISVASTQLIASLWANTVQKDTSFTTVAATSGSTVTLSGTRSFTAITQTQTSTNMTITLPASPVNGQIAKVSFTNIVTTLTVNAPGGATVVSAPAAAVVSGAYGWIYQTSNTSWYQYL